MTASSRGGAEREETESPLRGLAHLMKALFKAGGYQMLGRRVFGEKFTGGVAL